MKQPLFLYLFVTRTSRTTYFTKGFFFWNFLFIYLTYSIGLKHVLFQDVASGSLRLQQFTLTQPNSINILWLVPQERQPLVV